MLKIAEKEYINLLFEFDEAACRYISRNKRAVAYYRFPCNYAFFYTFPDYMFENFNEYITVCESAPTVLAKQRMVGYFIRKFKAAKPTVRQVERHFLRQTTFGLYTV